MSEKLREAGRERLAAMDRTDPLAAFRDEFVLPKGIVYLDGNSLGALPRATVSRLRKVVEREWGLDLIRSWTGNDWIGMPTRIGDKIGRLVGAAPGQVVVADSTSLNLHKALCAAVQLRPGRRFIVTEQGNFPSDIYIAEGLSRSGCQMRWCRPDSVEASLGGDVAVVMLTHVDFRTGRRHDLKGVTEAAQRCGAVMLWDLAHSAGAMPVELDGCGVDLAVGCGYKFLNGGPGAPAFLYVARRHQAEQFPALPGWMGHADPFAFAPTYEPAAGVARHLCGTPPVLSMAALEVAVDQLLRADLDLVREKSVRLGQLFIELVEERCDGHGLEILSPRTAADRGSQVCLTHGQGHAIIQELMARGVIGDSRPPDVLRFGLAPLYLRYVDIWDAVESLRQVMATRAWDDPAGRHR